ncbi:MAG: glycosyltransferase family 39 protein [Myxococcota bacterium]
MSAARVVGAGRLSWRDQGIGALLCLVYVGLLFATSGDLAMSRDESFYVIAAQDYGRWIADVWAGEDEAMSRAAIDAAWDYNHEHPALIKTAFALSWLAQERWELFPSLHHAFRFPGMLTAGLLLWLIFVFGAEVFGRRAGAFAALAFALMPRVFYHAHLDCFDVPIVLMVTWTTYAYWRALAAPRWALLAGLAFGCALATKHNAWILPGVFLIHQAWLHVGRAALARSLAMPLAPAPRPWWLVAMVTLGPLIFVLSWPWLWHDTLPRLGWYVRFHVNHVYYNMAYFGFTWFEPPFPVSYPFVMTAITVPAVVLVLGLWGLLGRLRAMLPAFSPRLAEKLWRPGAAPDALFTDVLLVGALLAPLVVIALPSSPIFGGTKHWMPSYPFLAMYAGSAFAGLAAVAAAKVPRLPSGLAQGLVGAVMLAPSAVETAHSHPFGLSHYTVAAGGVPGAADLGMNRQFWGFTTGSLLPFLREALPNGGRVWLCDTTYPAWNLLQRDGLLPRELRAAGDLPSADLVLVHHEDHFLEVETQAWVAHGSARPVHVLTYDGVPIVTVYANPKSSRVVLPAQPGAAAAAPAGTALDAR